MRSLLPLLGLALVLAGCTQPSSPGDGNGTPPPAAPPMSPTPPSPPSPPGIPPSEGRDIPFTFPKINATSPPGGSFEVPNGTLRVTVTATWTCSGAPCRMELVLADANGTALAFGDGNGTANATVEVGRTALGPDHPWGVSVLAREEGVRATGTLAVRFVPSSGGSPA